MGSARSGQQEAWRGTRNRPHASHTVCESDVDSPGYSTFCPPAAGRAGEQRFSDEAGADGTREAFRSAEPRRRVCAPRTGSRSLPPSPPQLCSVPPSQKMLS